MQEIVTKELLEKRFERKALSGRVLKHVNKRKEETEAQAYWVSVKNTRTGYTKLMPREKAYRYVNARPSLWKYTNPLPSFKDTYEEEV